MGESLWWVLLIALLIGLVSGYVGGLLGVGGGIIIVPALLLALPLTFPDTPVGFNAAKTVSSVAIVGVSIVGTMRHHQFKNVDVRLGLLLGAFGIPGALLGAYVGARLDNEPLRVIFGIVMLVSAFQLRREPSTQTTPSMPILGLLGFGGGVLAGLLGVGGGIIIVNGMLLLGFDAHLTVGTSMLAIVLNAGAATASNTALGFMRLDVALPLTAASVVGVYGGATRANSVDTATLRGYFRSALVLVGSYMLLEALWPLLVH